MSNLSSTFKKFMGNKNTVTIVGVLIAILVLYFGYNFRINQAVKMMKVPYALETIQPKTKITKDMIGYMEIPQSFEGSYYTNVDNLIGKYSNYNTIIPSGSLFYNELVITEDQIPDSVFYNVEEGYVVDNFKVDMNSTYANSIMPDSIINIYVKYINNGKVSYGKFMENINVLAVKDSEGVDVFANSDEIRTPSYMFMAFEENKYLAFKMLQYVKDYFGNYNIEIVITPNTIDYKAEEEGAIKVSSTDITNFILNNVAKIDNQDAEFNKLYEELKNQTATDQNNQ